MEISYSRFERTIELPAPLAAARLAIEHRHGLLLVRVEPQGADDE
jgi:HSP20 family molecular chaperone IbpA